MIKVIKSDSDYEAALADVEQLLDRDPAAGTREAEELGVLAVLVDDYESRRFGKAVADPIEAIRFRMEQQNLSQRDLVPFIGSRSKVSEVLSRKRPLTLSMIRALHSGLGIPAKVLLQERAPADLEPISVEWERFPLQEMVARGWIEEKVTDLHDQAEEVLRRFFAQLGPVREVAAFYRQTQHIRSGRGMDGYALSAWAARILIRALKNSLNVAYNPGSVSLEFMRELARLSILDRGPLLAQEYLAKHGIPLIIEPHLPRTYLDGAAITTGSGGPVVALTLRHDRIDNFWFSLMHELVHVAKHLGQGTAQFLDDLDVGPEGDSCEGEADQLAGEALIPEEEWLRSPASHLRSAEAAQDLARRLRIHPAIVAGRIRHHFKSYRVLNHMVGHGEVRRLFTDVKWS
jgi:HTH-type transcriptional regulator/antitoxin HigA